MISVAGTTWFVGDREKQRPGLNKNDFHLSCLECKTE